MCVYVTVSNTLLMFRAFVIVHYVGLRWLKPGVMVLYSVMFEERFVEAVVCYYCEK